MIDLKDSFDVPFNEPLVHQVVVSYMANARQSTSSQKTRSDVAGRAKKPWRQKGTGRARAGSSKSVIWRGGGVAFSSAGKNYKQKVHKKVYKAAMRSILSELVRQDRIESVSKISLDIPNTKQLLVVVGQKLAKKTIILVDSFDSNLYLSSRNVPGLYFMEVAQLDPVSLLSCEKVLLHDGAAEKVKELWG